MYRIKQKPEDFIVREVSKDKYLNTGEYTVFLIRKKNLTTQKAIERIAKEVRINEKNISYAGAKDKNAVTEQRITIKDFKGTKGEMDFAGIKLEFLGYKDEPISLGDLEGNEFEIVVRNIADEKIIPVKMIPNYYDDQRFGKNNVAVGKSILQKDYKKAVDAVLDSFTSKNNRILQHLQKNKNDYTGAIKTIPKKTRTMYVHSVQSLIFNKIVSEYLSKEKNHKVKYSQGELVFPEKEKDEEMPVPLIGFDFDINEADAKIRKITEKVLEEENIAPTDFIIKAFPEMTSETSWRNMFVPVEKLEIGQLKDDELNPGKKKVGLKFYLEKGSYATIAVKAMLHEGGRNI